MPPITHTVDGEAFQGSCFLNKLCSLYFLSLSCRCLCCISLMVRKWLDRASQMPGTETKTSFCRLVVCVPALQHQQAVPHRTPPHLHILLVQSLQGGAGEGRGFSGLSRACPRPQACEPHSRFPGIPQSFSKHLVPQPLLPSLLVSLLFAVTQSSSLVSANVFM